MMGYLVSRTALLLFQILLLIVLGATLINDYTKHPTAVLVMWSIEGCVFFFYVFVICVVIQRYRRMKRA
jgi:hypothetical protein